MSEISSRTLYQLHLLVYKLKNYPDYLAWVLAKYQKLERCSDMHMTQILGTTPEMFSRLALCKRPLSDDPDFAQQVKQIADYCAIDPTILANVIRQVDSLEALASMPGKSEEAESEMFSAQLKPGLLAAARDRLDGQHTSEEESIDKAENDGKKGRDDLAD